MEKSNRQERVTRAFCERRNQEEFPEFMKHLANMSERAGRQDLAAEFQAAASGPYPGSETMLTIMKVLQKENNHVHVVMGRGGNIESAILRTPDGKRFDVLPESGPVELKE